MGLFGSVGSVVKGATKGVLKNSGALAKEILKNAAGTAADAYKYQQKGEGMKDDELLDAYKNSKSQAEQIGYATALKSRMNS